MNATPGTANQRWTVTCQDAGDGSGDLIVPLPADLKSDMGLAVGDTLNIIKAYADTHKNIVLSDIATMPDRVDERVEPVDSQALEDIRMTEQRLSKNNTASTKTSEFEGISKNYQPDTGTPDDPESQQNHHDVDTLLGVLVDLYHVCGMLDAKVEVLDQIIAALHGDPLPHESLSAYADRDPDGWVPVEDAGR